MNKKFIALATAMASLASAALFTPFPFASANDNKVRIMEALDRGTVAVNTGSGVYLSWRLLGTEDLANQAFDIYRDGTKIHTTDAHDATCYTDTQGSDSSKYIVVPKDESIAGENAVTPWEASHYTKYGSGSFVQNQASYMDIPIIAPTGGTAKVETSSSSTNIDYTYSANDASVGDLNGDGQYELVLKWDPSNSEDSGKWNGNYTGNVYLDGYEISSSNKGYLWRIDLGCNIRAGAHYTQFIVYDLDGDGKAEIACKTAPGSKDGKGNYVTAVGDTDIIKNADNSIDYRKSEYGGSLGRIYQGPEYLTIFNGETGEAIYTTDYIARGNVSDWGDGGANRSERYLASVAYLNGETPSLIMTRGYYAKACAAAYNWDGEKLTRIWLNESTDETSYSVTDINGNKKSYNEKSIFAQGNHNLTSSDVDNDGYDEIVFGSAVIDHDGTVLNSTGHGHGDALHVSDFDNDGEQEIFQVHEEGTYYVTYGAELRKGKDASILQNQGTTADNGRGVMANCFDSPETGKSAQFWSAGVDGAYNFDGTSAGNKPAFTNHLIYWDADLGREALDGNKLGKYTSEGWKRFAWSSSKTYFPDALSNNDSKANPCLSADIFGDWREEVIFRTGDNNLRLYMSCIPTTYRLTTLMHNSQYRCAVAWQNVGYNQPPHTSYYIGSAALAKSGSSALNYLAPAVTFDEIAYPDAPERTPKPTLPPQPVSQALYERGTDNYPISEADASNEEWTQTGNAQLQFDSENKRLLYNLNPSESCSASKTFKVSGNAEELTYDIDWYFGSSPYSEVNYEYVQFGDNFRFGWNKTYNVYISVNGGNNYSSSIFKGGNSVYTKNIKAVIDLETNTVKSVTFDGKELSDYAGTAITNPNQISFGFQRPSKTGTWSIPCGFSKLVVTESVPASTPTPAPTASPLPSPTAAPTASPSPTPTTAPTASPSPSPTAAPTASPTPTPSATPTVAPSATPTASPSASPTSTPVAGSGYIESYNFENKYAVIHSNIDKESAVIIFASYDGGRLISIKTVNMKLENGETRNPMASDLENGETVKVFVWDSLNNPVPIMDAKEFRKD